MVTILTFANVAIGVLWIYVYAAGERSSAQTTPPSPRVIVRVFRWTHIPLAIIAFALALIALRTVPWEERQLTTELQFLLGTVVCASGVGLSLAARRSLGKNYSPCYSPAVPTSIIRTGPYSLISHPLYVGNLLTLGGWFMQAPNLLILIAWIHWACTYWISAKDEEQQLELVDGVTANKAGHDK